jgi:hypothetical protein
MAHRRALTGPMLAAVLVAGCGFLPAPPNQPSSAGEASFTPAPTSVPTPPPTPTPSPTPEPTPGADAVPVFLAGAQVATNADGLRVRSRPGVEQRVVTTLALDTDLLVALGPVLIDGFGWYQVANPAALDPEVEEVAWDEGWVAAGFEPDPFLISSSFEVLSNPFIAGFAHDTDGEFGPIHIPDANHGIRWIAANVRPNGCRFALDLARGQREPVPAVRTPVGGVPASGELFPQFFETHPDLIGDILVQVTSDCSWALTFVRHEEQTAD